MTQTAWGQGDLVTLAIACPVLLIALATHWRAIRTGPQPIGILTNLAGNALCLGPLLMILVDPLNKWLQLFNADLLRIVTQQSKLTLWLAALIALANVMLAMFRVPGGNGMSGAPDAET